MSHRRLATNERVATAFDEIDQAAGEAPRGATAIVITTVVSVYPTAAQAFYAVQSVTPGGVEVEGGAPTLTPVGSPFYAWNRGSAVPPQGANYLLAEEVGGRWTIDFNG